MREVRKVAGGGGGRDVAIGGVRHRNSRERVDVRLLLAKRRDSQVGVVGRLR